MILPERVLGSPVSTTHKDVPCQHLHCSACTNQLLQMLLFPQDKQPYQNTHAGLLTSITALQTDWASALVLVGPSLAAAESLLLWTLVFKTTCAKHVMLHEDRKTCCNHM